MGSIMDGEATPAQIGALLAALPMQGETEDEVVGFAPGHARARAVAAQRAGAPLDTCGTGGDGAGTFNISTIAAFVVAACGVRVAKHGNRSVSSGAAAAPTCSRRSESGSTAPPTSSSRALDRRRLDLPVRAHFPRRHPPRGRAAPRAGSAHGLQPARTAHQPRPAARPGRGRAPSRPRRLPRTLPRPAGGAPRLGSFTAPAWTS